MALAKIKLDEVDVKVTPVLTDSVLMSDSEDDGRGKISTVDTILGIIKGTPPETLDTLAKLAAAINDDPAFHTTLATALGLKQDASNAVTTDGEQVIDGSKTLRHAQGLRLFGPAGGGSHYGLNFGINGNTRQWYTLNYNAGGANQGSIAIVRTDGVVVMRWEYALGNVSFPVSPTVPTATSSDNSTLAASTAFVQAQKVNTALTGTPTAPTAAPGTNTQQIANCAFVQAATASAIYDLPVTRSGLASPGTDVVLFETGVLDPAWYDETHVLNVSFFARNNTGISDSTVFRFQLYDESTSTAYTVASVTTDSLNPRYMQASIYRASPTSVNCNASYGSYADAGFVTLASGSYKLRVVCNSSLLIVFSGAQVRFTK